MKKYVKIVYIYSFRFGYNIESVRHTLKSLSIEIAYFS